MKRAASGSVTILLALSAGAQAQEQQTLRGRVLDAETAAPVYAAVVGLANSNRGVLTDSLGLFTLDVESASAYVLRVTQLGYRDLEAEVDGEASERPFTLLVSPDPLEIEGLTVLADRLAERRRGPFGAGVILDRSQLLNSPDGSGYDLIRRMLPFVEPCGLYSEALCLGGRSGRRPVSVCVDDHRVPETMMETALAGVDPRGLYLVEVYSRVGEVRMYSPGYMKRLIEAGGSLRPLTFGCRDDRMQ